MRRKIQYLRHNHTICFRAPTANTTTTALYFNETIINQTLQFFQKHSPYSVTRVFIPKYVMEVIRRDTTNLSHIHR